jgi:anaerobic C4-dicarboxylate transporter DcuA
MPFLLFRFTKSQQFNINLLKNKEGVYVWCRTRDCPAGDLPGSQARRYRHRLCRWSGRPRPDAPLSNQTWRDPFDVIEIIMAVIAAIAAMQVAGGMDYLVSLAERMLRRHPKYITFLAPLVTWFMTVLAGTGHTAFSTLPVITEVAKEQGIRPSRPLSIAVVASQIAITASPISAAVVFLPGSSSRWA